MLICQNTFYACLHIKSHQYDANRRDSTCIWLQSKICSCFYYDFYCRHINDNAGDIKLAVVLLCQNTFCACWHIKSHQNDANRRNLMFVWLQSIKSAHVFIITSIVGILMTMLVILNLLHYYCANALFTLVCI